ncbi:DUF3895 domain-containing protein [Priestia aryabhattai]
MKIHLERKERDIIFSSLSNEQKNFIKSYLKRGKQTLFANELAKSKGRLQNSDKSLMKELLSWELTDYIDAGKVDPNYKCECGRPLRHQYIVYNKVTNETKKFGSTHLQLHTGIPAELAKNIIKGFDSIDYEMDEVLYKFKNGWDKDILVTASEYEVEIPKAMNQQVKLNIPLLDTQIKKLNNLIESTKENYTKVKFEGDSKHRLEFIEPIQTTLNEDEQELILFLLDIKDTVSVLTLCEALITVTGSDNEKFSTGKPRLFSEVVPYLNELVKQGKCTLIEKNWSDLRYKGIF